MNKLLFSAAAAIFLAAPGHAGEFDLNSISVPGLSGADSGAVVAPPAPAVPAAAQPEAAVNFKLYKLGDYSKPWESYPVSDPLVARVLAASGLKGLGGDLHLVEGGGTLGVLSRFYGNDFDRWNNRNICPKPPSSKPCRSWYSTERAGWVKKYFAGQDELEAAAAKALGREPAAVREQLLSRFADAKVIYAPADNKAPAGMLFTADLCIKDDSRLDTAYPPFGPETCPGRMAKAISVYSLSFDTGTGKFTMEPLSGGIVIQETSGARRILCKSPRDLVKLPGNKCQELEN